MAPAEIRLNAFRRSKIPRKQFLIINKFRLLGKIGFSTECFTADFWQFSSVTIEYWLLGSRLGTWHQFQVFQGFS